jgi:hypothetical protein
MLFKEVIAVYNENHMEFINTKYSVTNWETRWYIYLPLGVKELILSFNFVSHIKGRT